MPEDSAIRPARPRDEDAIHASCVGDAFAGRYVPPAAEQATRQESWTGPIGSPCPRHALLVAERSARAVGFSAVGPTRDPAGDTERVGELRTVMVEADHLRSGVGFALIDAAERAMGDSGLLLATLWVLPENAPAVRCYERAGWLPDGAARVGAFGGREIRSVRYAKQLAR